MATMKFEPLKMLKTFKKAIIANKTSKISFVNKNNEKKILNPLDDLIKAFMRADERLGKEKAKRISYHNR